MQKAHENGQNFKTSGSNSSTNQMPHHYQMPHHMEDFKTNSWDMPGGGGMLKLRIDRYIKFYHQGYFVIGHGCSICAERQVIWHFGEDLCEIFGREKH
jgi:hypothetical protein